MFRRLDGLAGTPDRRLERLRADGMDMAGISGSAVTMNGPATAASRTRGGFRDTTVAGLPPGPDSLARLANELEAGRLDPGDVRDHPLYIVNRQTSGRS